FGPKQHDAHHFRPKLRPFFAAEIERENVLVFFWRILREFDRAVRPLVKPIRMFADVRMVGRTIDREIKRDLHSAFSHFALEPIEIFERTQRGLHRFVTASFASDRPGHAGIAWLCSHGIVSPFAISMSDRMNRWEINYVEAHRPRVINSGQTITKCRSAIAATFGRAWKKFIPGGDLRFFPFHDHAWRRRILRRPRT